ncbi:hypothetical protein [Streptomyces sporangiiformans]|uniref:Uncharacterized protein n=1 Tax=Streptomyces sporangiiformans TaxID=2315329 RepID=A0A505DRV5_9ACTN|nr:hypothetical protein [Streptomyces sporangiiformans]TPQ24056.1 hypothetical protein FGD71_000800 [Streptomyces sporangiiformans]
MPSEQVGVAGAGVQGVQGGVHARVGQDRAGEDPVAAGGAVRNSLRSSSGSLNGHSALRSAVLLAGPAS